MDPAMGLLGGGSRRSSPRGRRARAGRGAVLLVLAVAALGTGAALMLFDEGDPAGDRDGGQGRDVEAAEGAGAIPVIEGPDVEGQIREDLGPTSSEGIDVRRVGDYARMDRVFEGTGTIAGSVSVEGGARVPAWTLHIEPSVVTAGADTAVERTVVAEPGALTFEERDLPLAAYRVYVTADGYRSRATEVTLFKIANDPQGRALEYVSVDLKLRRIATVSGRVLDADGGVADDLEVFLISTSGDTRVANERQRTDVNGRFEFEFVSTGPWKLHVGHPTKPLAPAVPVSVDLAPVTLDDVELPVLASIELVVVDEFSRPFPRVSVVGYPRGPGAGRISGETDGQGRFTARYMTPGKWRIEARCDPAEGEFQGKYDYDITRTTETQQLEMVLREPR